MKKFVGLLLSLAMAMSMMVVTVSAASFSDEETAQLRAEIIAKSAVDSVNASDEIIPPDYFDSRRAECDNGADAYVFTDEEIAQLRAEITAKSAVDSINASDEVILPNYFDSRRAKCDHEDTEKTKSFVGQCCCGNGYVYEITCKPCGAFVIAMCTNSSCTNWD